MKYSDLLINDMFITAPFKKDREKELKQTFPVYIKADGVAVKRSNGDLVSIPIDEDVIRIE